MAVGSSGAPAPHTTEFSPPYVFNLVLILRVGVDAKVVDAHYDLARRIAVALVHEERRVGYLTREIRTMIRHLDAAGRGLASALILSRSELARDLRKVCFHTA